MRKTGRQNRSKSGKFVYRYPRPMLTADSVILAKLNSRLCVLLVRRKHPPYRGYWALPGGFVDPNEQALDAAQRELTEETGLTRVKLKPIGFFGTPGRDPRGWVVSVVHLGFVGPSKIKQLRPGDDAGEIIFQPLRSRTRLAFDHADIIRYAARWLRCHGLPGRQTGTRPPSCYSSRQKKRESG